MESAPQPNCTNCALRPDRLFCNLPSESLQVFESIKSVSTYPRGVTLFNEERPARGVYVLCEGKAKLSISSDNGKRLLIRIAGPGEVLGLSSTLTGSPYEFTAETIEPCQLVFIKRKDILKFLREHRQACMQVVQLLSGDLHVAYERVRSLGLSRTRKPRAAQARAARA